MYKKIVVIYHGDCADGFGGAWAARKKLGDSASYIPAFDRVNPPEGLEGKIIYLIDYSYPREAVLSLKEKNKKVILIDHHVTAEGLTEILEESSFSTSRSGAVLAWQYFHGTKPIPRFLRHIEDSDLWAFRMKDTKEVMGFLDSSSFDFKLWDKIVRDFEKANSRKKYIEKGKIIVHFQNKLIEELAHQAVEVEFEGYRVLAVNAPLFKSTLGNMLALQHPPFAIIWSEQHGQVMVSLRSAGKEDIEKIARKYGGGGHPLAAGFRVKDVQSLPWKKIHAS